MKSTYFFASIMCLSILQAHAMAPGTVINPVHHSGQCTVSEIFPKIPSNVHTLIGNTKQSCKDIFNTKGIPILLSHATSSIPWWALTTGSGYLLVTSSNTGQTITRPLLEGMSYAVGQQIANNPCSQEIQTKKAMASLSLLCLIMAYYQPHDEMQNAIGTLLYAFIFQMLMNLYEQYTYTQNKNHEQSHQATNKNVTTFSYMQNFWPSIILYYVKTENNDALLQALLFEQSYRLAKQGCIAAQQLLCKPETKRIFPHAIEIVD